MKLVRTGLFCIALSCLLASFAFAETESSEASLAKGGTVSPSESSADTSVVSDVKTKTKSKVKSGKAHEVKKTVRAEELRKGVIASNSSSSGTAIAVDSQNTTEPVGEEKDMPIAANVSRVGTDCQLSVNNTSKSNKYSVNLLVEFLKDGRKVNSRSFYGVRVAPGGSATKKFSCPKDAEFKVILKGGQKVS